MCGRFTEDLSEQELRKRWDVRIHKGTILPLHYNGAPSQAFPVITNKDSDKVTIGTWGLVPVWAEKSKYKIKPQINARAETITERATFRNAFKKHRCLVPARSFFEWDRLGGTKVPYRIFLDGKIPFAFAGIFEYKKDSDTPLFSLITTDANVLVHRIHDRMPVILTKKEEDQWLADEKPERLIKLLNPYPANKMDMYEISKDVNSVRNDNSELLKQV